MDLNLDWEWQLGKVRLCYNGDWLQARFSTIFHSFHHDNQGKAINYTPHFTKLLLIPRSNLLNYPIICRLQNPRKLHSNTHSTPSQKIIPLKKEHATPHQTSRKNFQMHKRGKPHENLKWKWKLRGKCFYPFKHPSNKLSCSTRVLMEMFASTPSFQLE